MNSNQMSSRMAFSFLLFFFVSASQNASFYLNEMTSFSFLRVLIRYFTKVQFSPLAFDFF